MDLASTPVIKTDQTRSNPGAATAALLKNVPSQQGRFITSLQQSAPASLSSVTPSGISQSSVTKQAMNSVSRLAALPVHSSSSSTYHVPRGAAAVANIAVPRTSLATPIRGSSANLQALGVAAPNNSTMVRGAVPHTVGVRSSTATLHVAGGGGGSGATSGGGSSSWLSNNSSSSIPRPPHHPPPPPPSTAPTTTLAAHFTRASPMGVTRLATPMTSGRVMTESLSRPVLLQSTTHKQIINQSQQAQMHMNDKTTFLKTGVSMGVSMRPQTAAVVSSGGSGAVSNRPTPAAAAGHNATSSLNRIAASTLPPVVSLHPTVLVQTPSVPLKTQPSHTPKFLAQSSHIQMQPLSVNSIAPSSTIAMTTVSKPMSFSTTSTMAGIATTAPRPTLHNINTSCPTSKVLPSTSEPSLFIQTAHKQPTASSVTVPNVGSSNLVGSIGSSSSSGAVGSGGGYQFEPTAGPLQPLRAAAAANFAASSTTTQQPSSTTHPHTHTPITCRPASSIVTNSQPTVRYNPVMVVDPNRQSSLHHFVNNPPSEAAPCDQRTTEGSTTVPAVPTTVTQTPTKPNASPRPSILRKRESEGSPLKAQKNLTPLLTTLSVVAGAPSSPPSPKRPESRGGNGGGGGGLSSGGSTTISATSSPGLPGAGDRDSPPPLAKQEIQPEPPPLEMSPRKKPRKQQLTGNQMLEPKNEVEMEFISEEKLRKESKEGDVEESSETVLPKALPKRPNISLLSSYRHTWKSRHHHFLRYTDIKPKEERRPSINEIATQKMVQQKINGWKLYHLGTQMQCLSDLETEVLEKLTDMLKVLERKPGKELDKDINRVNELIKGNIQRCKVIKDQMQEAKTQVMKIFDHKGHVIEILSRCSSKRSVKKRDRDRM